MNALEDSVASEPIEAVIISGLQRGKIIRLSGQPIRAEPPHAEIDALNDALDQLIAKLDKVSAGIPAASGTMQRASPERS